VSATVLSPSATSVKIARTTSDGNWTVTQPFSQITGTPLSGPVFQWPKKGILCHNRVYTSEAFCSFFVTT
jgi:hypothetical protein